MAVLCGPVLEHDPAQALLRKAIRCGAFPLCGTVLLYVPLTESATVTLLKGPRATRAGTYLLRCHSKRCRRWNEVQLTVS